MTLTQPQQGLLAISNDSFLVGLLTGYSAANNFSFSSIPSTDPLAINSVNRVCRMILYDQRSLAPLKIAEQYQILERINCQFGIPICVIYNQNEQGVNKNIPWVSYFNENDLISLLDSYITKLIITSSTQYNERRNLDRRASIDRRQVASALQCTLNGNGNGNGNTMNYQRIENRERFYLGPFDVDVNSHIVYYKTRNLTLTAKEFNLFMLLADAHDQVCSTETIIAKLWPNTLRANKSDLYQYMHLLRRKVEEDPENPQWILTVKGVGYSLNTKEL